MRWWHILRWKGNVEMIHEKYIEKHVLKGKRRKFFESVARADFPPSIAMKIFFGKFCFSRKHFCPWLGVRKTAREVRDVWFFRGKLLWKKNLHPHKEHSWKEEEKFKWKTKNLQICQNIYNKTKNEEIWKIKIYQGKKTWKCVSHDHHTERMAKNFTFQLKMCHLIISLITTIDQGHCKLVKCFVLKIFVVN